MRKQKRAAELEGTFDALRFQGYTLVYTDGSSTELEGVGRVAGYRTYVHPDVSIAAHVPVSLRQTNNTAELPAAIRALQIFTFRKIAICTHSWYVLLGAAGPARRWLLRGWVGSKGPVSNVPPWEVLLETLSTHNGLVKFVKVPSHVNIIGNSEADRLADQGRLSHPPCPVLRTLAHQDWSCEAPPPLKRRRRVSCTDLQSVSRPLCFYTTKAYPSEQSPRYFLGSSSQAGPGVASGRLITVECSIGHYFTALTMTLPQFRWGNALHGSLKPMPDSPCGSVCSSCDRSTDCSGEAHMP